MTGKEKTWFFLGSNSSQGFFSLYDELKKEASFIWYIKGGPGNGKSSFMKAVASAAERAGHPVDYILCSGDPVSLDGIIIRDLGVAYTDATSPHVQEPELPGAGGRYIDLSLFYTTRSGFDAAAISQSFAAYRAEYARAYDLFSAAVRVSPNGIPGLLRNEEIQNAFDSGRSFADQMISEGNGCRVRRRFMSAYTCAGRVFCPYPDAKIYYLESSCGLEDQWFRGAAEICFQKDQNVIICPDPLTPEKTEALILPDEEIAFVKKYRGMKKPKNHSGTIRPGGETVLHSLPELQQEYKSSMFLQNRLLVLGTEHLKKAKLIHDELEGLYHPFVDFNALEAFTEEHFQSLCL